MPASVREKLNPNTVIRELDKVQTPRSNVSARAFDSYAQARPEYIAPDYQAGKGYERLARSLSSFNKEITSAYDTYVENKREESEGLGKTYADKIQAEFGSQLSWKEATEQHPELEEVRKKNPWVVEGYQKAQLQTLALEAMKKQEEAYIKSGMQNEEDTAKVSQFNAEFFTNFMEENKGLFEKYNPQLVSEAYTPIVERAQASLLSRHTSDMEAQRETRLMQASLEKARTASEFIMGNEVLSSEKRTTQNLDQLYNILITGVDEARQSGMRDAKAVDLYVSMVQALVAKNEDNESLLKLLDKEVNGVRPSSLPEVAKWITTTRENNDDRRYKETIQSLTLTEKMREEREYQNTDRFYQFMLDNPNATMEEQREFIYGLGLSATETVALINTQKNYGALDQAIGKNLTVSQAIQLEEITQGDLANMTEQEARDLAAAYNNPEIIALHRELQEEQNKTLVEEIEDFYTHAEDFYKTGFSLTMGKAKKQELDGFAWDIGEDYRKEVLNTQKERGRPLYSTERYEIKRKYQQALEQRIIDSSGSNIGTQPTQQVQAPLFDLNKAKEVLPQHFGEEGITNAQNEEQILQYISKITEEPRETVLANIVEILNSGG